MENEYAEKAHAILDRINSLRKEGHCRPLMIEVTGTPDSGKTSIIVTLERFFSQNGWKVWNPPEGAEITKLVSRKNHLYNIKTGIYALGELLENANSHNYHLVIFDRAIYDAFCWQKYWLNKGKLSAKQTEINQQFFMQPLIARLIDGCFFMVCSPEEIARRKNLWDLRMQESEISNPRSSKNLINIWKESFELFNKEGRPVSLVDTTNMAPLDMGRHVLEKTLYFAESYLEKVKSA